jgi:hypothetical protein
MVITNADYVSWKGKKTKKDFTYAKKTFEKCSNIFWLKMINREQVVAKTGERTSLRVSEHRGTLSGELRCDSPATIQKNDELEIIFDESESENEKIEEKESGTGARDAPLIGVPPLGRATKSRQPETKDLKLLRKNFLDKLSNKK